MKHKRRRVGGLWKLLVTNKMVIVKKFNVVRFRQAKRRLDDLW